MKKMVFAELDIPLIDKSNIISWISEVPEKHWFFDNYRQCFLLPLMTRNNKIKNPDMFQHNARTNTMQYSWEKLTPDSIKTYFEKNIFNWTKMKSRITIIKTLAGGYNPIHIDCFPEEFNTIQHKLRIVIQGTSDTLYFETQNGKIWAPPTEKPFIIDGSWPHGMINNSKLCKYTICLGTPWTHSDHYPGLNPLIFIDKKELPEHYKKWFKTKKPWDWYI